MGRKRKELHNPRRYIPVNDASIPINGDTAGPSRANETGPSPVNADGGLNYSGDDVPYEATNFWIVCPCLVCERRPKPWRRRHDIVKLHLQTHMMGRRHKVLFNPIIFAQEICSHEPLSS